MPKNPFLDLVKRPFKKSASGEANSERDALKTWTTRITRARTLRENWEKEYDVAELERFILGKHFSEGTKGTSVYNHFRATIRTIMPSLALENPKFFVRPKPGLSPPTNELKASQGESILEAIATQEQHLTKQTRLALLQAFVRIGVLKVVYDPKLVPNPRAGEPIMQQDSEGNPILDPQTLQPQPIINMQGEPIKEPKFIINDEIYRWEWVDGRSMLFPDAGPDASKWPWIGEEVVVPLEDAQDDDRFNKDARERLKPNISREVSKRGKGPSTLPQDRDEVDPMMMYVELYDMKTRKHVVIAEGQDEDIGLLLEEDLPEGIEDHPYSVLTFQPILGPDPSPWPYPETHDWKDIQTDYNLMRKMQVEGSRRATRKFGYEEGTFADEDAAIRALQSPVDMEAFKVTDLNKMPKAMDNPSVTADSWRNVGLLQTDWQIITGQTGARLSDPDANSATEAIFSERASNLRDADMQSLVNQWLSDSGRKMLQLVQKTLALRIWVRLVSVADQDLNSYLQRVFGIVPEDQAAFPGLREAIKERIGNMKWQSLSREDLEFAADVTVVPGSTKPRNLDQERRQWLEFLTIIGQAPQLALSRELLRETASKFEHINERMIDELVALAERMNQIQMQKAGRNQGGENAAGNGTTPSSVQQLAQSIAQG